MPLDFTTLLTLASACAPAVAPTTLLAVAQVESGFDPLAIGVNGPGARRVLAKTPAEAIRTAQALIAAGRNVDLGLGQINMRNLAPLGLSVAAAFDPCRNLAASARVLQAGYLSAAPAPGAEEQGLRTALSLYNTGDPVRGLRNGYVAKVSAAAEHLIPVLTGGGAAPVAAGPAAMPPVETTPAWAVFGGPPAGTLRGGFVLSPGDGATP